jgi:GAF domain-containing protein
MIDGERLVGVFDLDSPLHNRFDATDQAGIEAAVRLLLQACRSSS